MGWKYFDFEGVLGVEGIDSWLGGWSGGTILFGVWNFFRRYE